MPRQVFRSVLIVLGLIFIWPDDVSADARSTALKRGNIQLKNGNIAASVKTFKSLTAAYPNDAPARHGLAKAHNRRVDLLRDRNHVRAAAPLLRKVIEFCDCKPRDYAAHYTHLSQLLIGLSRKDEAVATAHSAVTHQPKSFKSHRALGLAHFERGHYAASAAAFEAALRLRPRGTYVASMNRVLRSAKGRRDDQGLEQKAKVSPAKSRRSSGSGFLISRHGHILTNAHVVRRCKSLDIVGAEFKYRATLVATDGDNDLALLKIPHTQRRVTVFRSRSDSLPGDPVVVSKLNALRIAKATGDVPQNINFKSSLARKFLDAQKVKYQTASRPFGSSPAKIARAVRKYSVLIRYLR